jgi:hypothetical protein
LEHFAESSTMASSDGRDAVLYCEKSHPFFLPVLAILPFLLPFFWTYRVEVSGSQLVFGYSSGLTRKSMDRSLLLSAEPIEYINGLLQWGGWGIRKNLRWETGYVASNGPAVRIKTRDNGGTYVFNCKDPQLVCQILNSEQAVTDSQ